MIKIILIETVVLLLVAGILFFLWRHSARKQKETKAALESTKKQLSEAIVYQAKLESTLDILAKNRKEANEKINSLHNGDSVDNAINELRKRKS